MDDLGSLPLGPAFGQRWQPASSAGSPTPGPDTLRQTRRRPGSEQRPAAGRESPEPLASRQQRLIVTPARIAAVIQSAPQPHQQQPRHAYGSAALPETGRTPDGLISREHHDRPGGSSSPPAAPPVAAIALGLPLLKRQQCPAPVDERAAVEARTVAAAKADHGIRRDLTDPLAAIGQRRTGLRQGWSAAQQSRQSRRRDPSAHVQFGTVIHNPNSRLQRQTALWRRTTTAAIAVARPG